MHIRQPISIGNLLLDITNYRIISQDSQKDARDAIIAEQGKKLVKLAADIIEVGLSPIDLTLVIDANDGNRNYIVIEGNRRITAINLLLKPELAEGTPVYSAFKKLHKHHADAIPKVLECVIVPDRKAGLVWINRKHETGLEGAGTEPWLPMAQARADVDKGNLRPDLDAVNFVLTNPQLNPSVRKVLEGAQFKLTSLRRLIETKGVQHIVGFTLQDGKLVADHTRDRIQGILTDIVTVIATGKHTDGTSFTVRDIDQENERKEFVREIADKHPGKKKVDEPWTVSGKPVKIALKSKARTKTTPSTEEQINLIPRSFKLELPAGKINDIFVELKNLNVMTYRHAVSVLFRVFFEFTLDDYIKKHDIKLPVDKDGRTKHRLLDRLISVVDHVKSTGLVSEKDLKPLNVAISDKDSFLSPETLNAYVHSAWMNPDAMKLKIEWSNIQLIVERLWRSENKAGHAP